MASLGGDIVDDGGLGNYSLLREMLEADGCFLLRLAGMYFELGLHLGPDFVLLCWKLQFISESVYLFLKPNLVFHHFASYFLNNFVHMIEFSLFLQS